MSEPRPDQVEKPGKLLSDSLQLPAELRDRDNVEALWDQALACLQQDTAITHIMETLRFSEIEAAVMASKMSKLVSVTLEEHRKLGAGPEEKSKLVMASKILIVDLMTQIRLAYIAHRAVGAEQRS